MGLVGIRPSCCRGDGGEVLSALASGWGRGRDAQLAHPLWGWGLLGQGILIRPLDQGGLRDGGSPWAGLVGLIAHQSSERLCSCLGPAVEGVNLPVPPSLSPGCPLAPGFGTAVCNLPSWLWWGLG